MNASTALKTIQAMSKRFNIPVAKLGEGFHEIRILVEEPYSPAANHVIEKVVARYNQDVFEMIADADLLLHPRWPAWHRLLQVRFIQLVCADRPAVAVAVRKELEHGKCPHPDKLMGEVFRQCFIDMFEYGREKKLNPNSRKEHPKRPDLYWREAFDCLDADMERERRQGRTIEDTPAERYSIFGVDYSLQSVRN